MLQSTWLTNDRPNSLCWPWSFSFYILNFSFYRISNDDRVKQPPIATKVRLFLVHDLSSRWKNVLDSVQPINIVANAFILPRSLKMGRSNVFFQIKPHPGFVKARPHYSQQSPRLAISTEGIVAFGFPWPCTRQPNPLAKDCRLIIAKTALKFAQSFDECAWMASTMLFEQRMVWDVDPVIFAKGETVLLSLLAITVKTSSQLQAQHANLAPPSPIAMQINNFQIGFDISLPFFFWISAKSYAGGWRET